MSGAHKYLLVLFMALALCVSAVAPALAEMRIFELQHRPASDLAETVRPLLSEQAKLAVHRNTLVVRGTTEELAEVASLVAAFDKPLAMLRISVEQGYQSQAAGRGLSASGSVSSGPVTVGVFNRGGRDNASIHTGRGDLDVVVRGSVAGRNQSRRASQFISVLDGSPATISVGRAVPFTSQLRYFSRRHPRYLESVSYQRVDTGFHVTPYLLGDAVDAEIQPYMAFVEQDKPLQIVFHELTTKVRIPVGSWYDLSRHMETQDDLSREILSVGSETGAESGEIRIRIDPQ